LYKNLNDFFTLCINNPRATLICLFISVAIIASIFDDTKQSNTNINRPASGELNKDSIQTNTSSVNLDSSAKRDSTIKREDYSDWDSTNYATGSNPGCFNFTPRYDKSINNHLEVTVGSNTDAVIKVINVATGRCIRYCYIRSDESYDIKHIPQGRYYLKIAYGTDWRQKIENGICKGKFIRNALYKRGDEILDFHKQYKGTETVNGETYRNYSIPSYSLSLDVVATSDTSSHYRTDSISEDDFNN